MQKVSCKKLGDILVVEDMAQEKSYCETTLFTAGIVHISTATLAESAYIETGAIWYTCSIDNLSLIQYQLDIKPSNLITNYNLKK